MNLHDHMLMILMHRHLLHHQILKYPYIFLAIQLTKFHLIQSGASMNIFDHLPALAAPKSTELRDELERYLSTDPEFVADVLLWWTERKSTYPRLSRMALDYLSIPGK